MHSSFVITAHKREKKNMKLLSAIVISLSLFGSAGAHTQAQETASDDAAPRSPLQAAQIKITPSGSQQSSKGPTEHFTGSVHIEQLFNVHAPSRSVGASVTFEPGARTAWHVHPLGQTLIVTAGVGRVQQWGGTIQEMRKGDVVWIPAGTKHWHGAAPTASMTHIAITEQLNGNVVEWQEKVSAEQYRLSQ